MAVPASAQEPVDLFPDGPALGDGFVRIAAWNLRYINVEGHADDFLPSATGEADFQILVATFAKALWELGLDVVAVSEHQPRSGRARLREPAVSTACGPLMEILTVRQGPLMLEEWASFRDRELLNVDGPVSKLVPFTRFNARASTRFWTRSPAPAGSCPPSMTPSALPSPMGPSA